MVVVFGVAVVTGLSALAGFNPASRSYAKISEISESTYRTLHKQPSVWKQVALSMLIVSEFKEIRCTRFIFLH